MQFQPIGYLEWIKQHFGRARYDLANPAVAAVSAADLGLTAADLALTGENWNGHPGLIAAISARFAVPPACVVLTDGASQGIALACLALLESGDAVLLEAPNYEPLYRLPLSIGCDVRILDRSWEKGFRVDLELLQRRITRNTKAVILTNLHNPSGVATDPEKLRAVCQVARAHGARVICSEVFRDLVLKGEPPAPAYRLERSAVSIGSISKIFGVDGIRLGWVLCDEELAGKLRMIRNHLSVMGSYLCEEVALAAFRRLDTLLVRARSIVAENLAVLADFVKSRDDLDWVPPDGGTIAFLRLRNGISSWDFARFLQESHQTLVVPGDFFWARGFLRVGFGGDPANLKGGLAGLAAGLASWRKGRSG
jgi:hypothetical protein